MVLNLKIETKIPEKEVTSALDDFVLISFKRSMGKSVSTWDKVKDGTYILHIAYFPQNIISDKLMQTTLQKSFRKKDKTATITIDKTKPSKEDKEVKEDAGKKKR